MIVSIEITGKNRLEPGQENKTRLQCCHFVLCSEIFDQTRPVCRRIVVKEKPTVGSPFFGVILLNATVRRRMKRKTYQTENFLVTIPINHTNELQYTMPENSKNFLSYYVFLVRRRTSLDAAK
jgi:hypothetical protein